MENQLVLNSINDALAFIKKGQLEEVVERLNDIKKYFPYEEEKEATLLIARFELFLKESRKGFLTSDENLVIQSKLVAAFNDFLEEIKDQLETHLTNAPKSIGNYQMKDLIWNEYFPNIDLGEELPFHYMLDKLFFSSEKDPRYPIHGPNVLRFTRELLKFKNIDAAPGLFNVFERENAKDVYNEYVDKIEEELFEKQKLDDSKKYSPEEINKHNEATIHREITTKELMVVAALYHDIGKYIKNHKHPEIGANIVRYYNPEFKQKLLKFLSHPNDDRPDEKRQHRFSLLTSIVKHHDKFGVVSTGEGSMALYSDILYYDSNPDNKGGIKKNVTAVMLLNLADIAAVNRASDDEWSTVKKYINIINEKRDDKDFSKDELNGEISRIISIIEKPQSCLGLSTRKLRNVLRDWDDLLKIIENVNYDKIHLKEALLNEAKKASRTIERVLRLVIETMQTSNLLTLTKNDEYINRSIVESILISKLGIYQFESFCSSFATVAKLDYGLRFFQSIACAITRKAIYKSPDIRMIKNDEVYRQQNKMGITQLAQEEQELLEKLSEEDKLNLAYDIADYIVKILEVLVSRYTGVFTLDTYSPRRYGLQMGELTKEPEVWKRIVSQLCFDNKEHFAFAWMIDEVTIWSFD